MACKQLITLSVGFLTLSVGCIHCNNLEKWLSERGYNEKLVRMEILKARSQSREH